MAVDTISNPNTMTDAGGLRTALRETLDSLKSQHLYRELRVLQNHQAAVCIINGKEVVNLSSNNYLGLCTDPRLEAAAKAAIDEWGVGSGAVRTIIGTLSIHQQLEQELAAFKHTEASLTFGSGFTANQGAIGSIVTDQDVVITDELNHASIIDGIRLTKAARKIYKHSDMDALEAALKETQSGYRLRLIITDGVFSMDGDIAKLPQIVELAERYGAAVYIDDAHASGVLGEHGAGSTSHFNLYGRVAVQIGTLSKAIGAVGGYVACMQELRDMMIQRARPFLFSTSQPPSVVATCREALRIMQSEPELHQRLWDNTRYFKAKLNELGFNTGQSETPITPVIVGTSETAGKLSDRLFQAGVFAQAIVFPTVAADKARVRTIVTAAHTRENLDTALGAFAQVGRELGII